MAGTRVRVSPTKVMRRAVDLALAGLVLVVVLVGLASLVAPTVGGRLLAVRTGSMAPTIPVGSLIVVAPVDPARVAVGDILTVRLDSGTALTHRLARIEVDSGRPAFRLKGDANAAADPTVVSADHVIGRVELSVWGLGFLLAMLSMPSGVVALMSTIGSLAVGGWLLGEFSGPPARPGPPRGRPRRRRLSGSRMAVAVALATLLVSGLGPFPGSAALATNTRTTISTITADVLDPPGNLRCNGGVALCNVTVLTKPSLTWNATADPYATGYRVLRSTTAGSGYTLLATVTGRTTTTYTDTSAASLTTYYYVVRSIGSVWVSANSNEVTVIVTL